MGKDDLFRPVFWDDEESCLVVLDQRALPVRERWLRIRTVGRLASAIRSLAVRGAPLLGVAAAYGVYLGVRGCRGSKERFLARLEQTIELLSKTRPTAVNLFSALRRAQEVGLLAETSSVEDVKARLLELGHQVLREEEERSFAIARHGADVLGTSVRVMTICNTGALAAGGVGTALGIIYEAFRRGYVEEVYVCETRPLLQGARLTAWELMRWGIPFRIIADGAAPAVMAQGLVDVVIVGADRIVKNGDVANKIGTYSLALAANRHRIPFIVAAPTSTFDLSKLEGAEITIEERPQEEVLSVLGRRIAPQGACALNPAFDVTPAELVTMIVTERGVVENPNKFKIAAHIAGEIYTDDSAAL